MKDNKLIAEFMGVHDEILSTGSVHSWSDAPFFYITEDSKEKVMEGIVKYSNYHTSWDWLMPVIQKCLFISRANSKGLKILKNIPYIDATYKEVVEIIKTYNHLYAQVYVEDDELLSDCCGAFTTDTEIGICPDCLEHCEFTNEEE